MKVIQLKPIRETTEEYDKIEARIKELFRKEIYLPLIISVGAKSKTLKNSTDDVLDAIRSGKIYFNRGKFKGQFNSVLSKELNRMGADWNKKESSFDIPKAKLHPEVKNAIDLAYLKFQDTAKKIDKKLSSIVPDEIADQLKIEQIFDSTLYKVEGELKKSMKDITVGPQLTPDQRDKLSREYAENMKLKIRGWMNDEILELRKKIQKQSFQGLRYESLIQTIQDSYRVSQNKAKFLARQETSLLITKFKEIRYEAAGVYEYRWKSVIGSPNHPVRPRHKQLNDESAKGKIFRFDNPPIVTEPGQAVRRANPGVDYNCRCYAVPLVKF